MTTEAQKINIIQRILNLTDHSILDKIESLLPDYSTVAYTSKGKPLTKNQYKSRIEAISNAVKEGAETYASDEIKKFIKNQ